MPHQVLPVYLHIYQLICSLHYVAHPAKLLDSHHISISVCTEYYTSFLVLHKNSKHVLPSFIYSPYHANFLNFIFINHSIFFSPLYYTDCSITKLFSTISCVYVWIIIMSFPSLIITTKKKND